MGDARRAGVDVGGTFTDVVAHRGAADGARAAQPRAVKVPTTTGDQSEGVADGVAEAGLREGLAMLAHGTTTATNAVLERDVARVVLVTTDGFRDLLTIGRQHRPALYDLSVVRPAPLVAPGQVVTVAERTGPDGQAVRALTDEEVARVADAVAALEPEAVAVSLLFAHADGTHERRIGEALADLGVPVTLSHELLPEFREFERTSTVVVNAAIAPVMDRYLSNLHGRLPEPTITVMTSGGGTAATAFAARAPVHTLLSGPAAGVVAAGAVARAAGHPDAVAFDMGGTSSDVCLIIDGSPQVATRSEIGGLPFMTPAVDIHTVGAGGGSIAWIDRGGALQVGPRSAGARPGPASYGHGGTEPTVTDAHCVLGHLDVNRRLGGGLELDRDAAVAALDRLPEDAGGAHGVLTVVRATMLRALRRVTTERGVDPTDLVLVAYGGAGPLHATALARDLGCRAVIVPPAPGVLSALGLLLAAPRFEAARTVLRAADDDALPGIFEELADTARRELADQGVAGFGAESDHGDGASLDGAHRDDAQHDGDLDVSLVADVRYARQAHELRLDLAHADVAGRALVERFHEAHTSAYGYAMPDEPVVVVTARAVARGRPVLAEPPSEWDLGEPAPPGERRVGMSSGDGGGEEVTARVVHRGALDVDDELSGPALVEQSDTTTLLAPGDTARVDEHRNLVVRW